MFEKMKRAGLKGEAALHSLWLDSPALTVAEALSAGGPWNYRNYPDRGNQGMGSCHCWFVQIIHIQSFVNKDMMHVIYYHIVDTRMTFVLPFECHGQTNSLGSEKIEYLTNQYPGPPTNSNIVICQQGY